ncbi:MAG: hypothetical protein GXY61_05980 [Lentisphaerae bacterium]|nr:hypothetical protein [Lentisphaerota bacterium]
MKGGAVMDREFPIVEWDGFHFGAVLTYWSQRDTLAGTVWRLVMDRGKTLVVVPYQTADAPAPDMHLPPERIAPVLAGIDFGWTVGRVASANVHIDRNWEWIIRGFVKASLNYWKTRQSLPAIKQFEEARREAHEEQNRQWLNAGLAKWEDNRETEEKELILLGEESARQKISDTVLAKVEEMQKDSELLRERALVDAERKKIEQRWRSWIEKAKAEREKENEVERLEELRAVLAGYGVEAIEVETLKELYDFIRDDVCSGNRMNPDIGESVLRRVVAKVKELTGADIAERVMESVPFVKGEMFNDAARRNILERVRFIAEFADGRKWLVEKIEGCIHCGRDAELFELVKPDEQERVIIEKRVEVVRIEAEINAKKRTPAQLQADREKKKLTPKQEDEMKRFYNKCVTDGRGRNAASLTHTYMKRAKEVGGMGLNPTLLLSTKQIKRICTGVFN